MKDFLEKILGTLLGLIWIAFLVFLPIKAFTLFVKDFSFPDISIPQNFVVVCIIFLVLLIIIINLMRKSSELKDEIYSKVKEIAKNKKEYENEITELNIKYAKELGLQKSINDGLYKLVKSKTPFKDVAELKADFETCIYEKDEHYLRYKPHPAKSSADKIKEIRTIFNENVVETKQMYYKYEFLMSVFPELKTYLEDEQSLIHLGVNSSFDSFEENRDRVLDWLSKEEYMRLSVSDRNQLALDRYKNRNKSNWEIGAEYELYIGYLLRIGTLIFGHEFEVDQYGVKERLNDLGRDIIAEEKDDFGNVTVYIIQCKRWAKDKLLHENVVCQLYGTSLEYELCHDKSIKVVPLLVTTAQLSDVAKKFAQRLGVDVIIEEMGEYPMIKCNIDSMIYHLPFDQQYYTTKVKESKGEFYAWTVEEAERRGYRRAMKYFG